ncbi:hypothetical protein C5E51_10905 [Nocardia nova]|uniref:hypothetical protein n=1 Tax=Nocardia nova TaxID=37330 RepID=UPI000CE9C506|nr:hypothetical protein [Nocardia nova]PPJ10756.1 hypothetical protein C5E51_10905 [Nocardia nova]
MSRLAWARGDSVSVHAVVGEVGGGVERAEVPGQFFSAVVLDASHGVGEDADVRRVGSVGA